MPKKQHDFGVVIKLTDRQTARWTTLASYHYMQWKDFESQSQCAGDLPTKVSLEQTAQWHKDATEFLRYIESQAVVANKGDATAVCPICDGRGAI